MKWLVALIVVAAVFFKVLESALRKRKKNRDNGEE